MSKFTSTNVAGPGYDKDPSEVVFEGCRCGVQSCGNQCPCIIRFGPNYDKNGRLMKVEEASVDKRRSETKPIVECNAMCECGERCSNRIVQNGPKFELEVFTTTEKGFGLRACEDIPKSSFVCEYAGEILSKVEAQRRTKLLADEDPNYILVVREFMEGGKLVETIIDPTYRGNKGRFINHSCEPNLSKVPVRVHNDIPKVALFALREIHQGEELTYSYGEETSVYSEDGRKRKPCHCGSKSCRQYLPFDRSLLS
ncbi:hypothetical protein BSL78_18436 [Apostichopus japonicus]|uniref:Histone-lysine N-methyltransferase SETMAR n=1 Tax=Stichopus japonicus TaxID=307972 RepID=A0A2G8K9N4_STIJA|nr:hypothetical protein BSL78_18436 [Apostichopus japonicus]